MTQILQIFTDLFICVNQLYLRFLCSILTLIIGDYIVLSDKSTEQSILNDIFV